MRSNPLAVRAAIVAAVCAFAVSACAAADATDLEQAEDFEAYRVYYAGPQVADLPLERVAGEDWKVNQRSATWTFSYGDCDPPSGEGGCQVPLQIQNFSICNRWPGKFGGNQSTFEFRGAKASRRRGRGFEVFTGHTTVVIFGTTGRAVKRAARRLRAVGEVNRPHLLPAPARGALDGKLPCQG